MTLGRSNCFTGLLDSERREERDITLSDFNILFSDTDRRFELSEDMADSLGAADDPPSLLRGGSWSRGTGSSTCTQSVSATAPTPEEIMGVSSEVFCLSDSWEGWWPRSWPLCFNESEDEWGLECLVEPRSWPLRFNESEDEWGLECLVEPWEECEPLCFKEPCEEWVFSPVVWWGQGSWLSGTQGDWSAGISGGGGAGLWMCFFFKWKSKKNFFMFIDKNQCYFSEKIIYIF